MTDFAQRTVLVTGAAGSIGQAVVRRLGAANARVLAADRHSQDLAAITRETGATAVAFDLTDEGDVERALADLPLYGVVNCAGYGGELAAPQDTSITVFDRAYQINARGSLLVTKYAARAMIRAGGGGSIVNVSSQAALVALRGHISYAASKAALDSITRSSALELGAHGIRVNSVNPTAVMTRMSIEYWTRPEVQGPFLEAMPLGRYATEDEIAAPVVFLLSDDAAMITGVSLPVDGGYTMQ